MGVFTVNGVNDDPSFSFFFEFFFSFLIFPFLSFASGSHLLHDPFRPPALQEWIRSFVHFVLCSHETSCTKGVPEGRLSKCCCCLFVLRPQICTRGSTPRLETPVCFDNQAINQIMHELSYVDVKGCCCAAVVVGRPEGNEALSRM